MFKEGEKPKDIQTSSDIKIIGTGTIGEKAKQLVEKTPTLKSIGFHVPKRTILAQDFFNDIFVQNGLGSNLTETYTSSDLENKIKQGILVLPKNILNPLQEVFNSYGSKPLVLRSSGAGDARGTGTYKSEFTENKEEETTKALKNVLASYFSKDAIAFRKDAKTGEGFGIMIEPIVGQELGGCFAPVLSGFGYTSTSRGEGYIAIVPGLGCAVDSKDGERIMKSQIEEHKGLLNSYLDSKVEDFIHGSQINKSALLRLGYSGGSYHMKAFFPSEKYRSHAEVSDASWDFPDDIQEKVDSLNLLPFFSKIEQMEQAFGKPQYFEWAMTIESGEPTYWIIQIADINKKLDLFEFEDLGETMFIGHTVTGAGVKESSKIAFCWNPDDIYSLNRFNNENKDYILLYSSRLTTTKELKYSYCNNASVFLEIQDSPHVNGDPISHFGGQLDMTGKLLGVLDYHAEIPPNWNLFDKKVQKEDGLRICSGKFKVVGSERQNKIVIYNSSE